MLPLRALAASLSLAAAAAATAAAAPPAAAHQIASPASGETRAALAQVRAPSAAYHDLDAAIADGFVQSTPCVSNPDGPGATGVHQVDPARLATGLELTRPEVLIYEPQENGRTRLVGVEHVVFDADQDPATDERPTFPGGVRFHGSHGGGAAGPLS